MFSNLLESRACRDRSLGGHFVSAMFHTTALTMAVLATHRVVGASERAPVESISYVSPTEPQPAPIRQPAATTPITAPLPPRGFQILQAPIQIPDLLPPVDVSKPVTNAADYTARDVPGGTADGTPGGVPRPGEEVATYLQSQVEKPAAHIPGTGVPEYPEALKNAGVEGVVQVAFAVDTTGKADLGTLRVLSATQARFTEEVTKALPRMRFFPAEIGGRKVRQLVQLPFVFAIR